MSQDQKLRIPYKPLINNSIISLAMAQPGSGRNSAAKVFCFPWDYERWDYILRILASASILYILIFTFKHSFPCCSGPCSTYKELKGNIFFVGVGGSMPWHSGWVISYLFTFKNNFAFGPVLLDDERHFELLEDKGLLSLFRNFSCLYQCLISIFHSFLPPSFLSQLSLPFVLAINKEWKAKHNSLPWFLTMISLWGTFSEASEKRIQWFLSPQFSAALGTMALLPTSKGQDETWVLFFLSFPNFKLEQTIFT